MVSSALLSINEVETFIPVDISEKVRNYAYPAYVPAAGDLHIIGSDSHTGSVLVEAQTRQPCGDLLSRNRVREFLRPLVST